MLEIRLDEHSFFTGPIGEPVIVFREVQSGAALIVWMGVAEANAIIAALNKEEFPRPMTHDLVKNLIEFFGAKVVSIVITDLQETTYIAALILECGGSEYQVDCRPSDGVAVALRFGAPIYVTDEVFMAIQDSPAHKSMMEQIEAAVG